MTRSLVSVIIPVYNGERNLAEAIESVIAQIYKPVEIIVADDGSADKSAGVVRRFDSSVSVPVGFEKLDSTLLRQRVDDESMFT